MTGGTGRRRFSSRPADPEGWIRAADTRTDDKATDNAFTARLTVDITLELRGRIKIAAFQRGVTAAEMLRDLLAREFPPTSEGDLG